MNSMLADVSEKSSARADSTDTKVARELEGVDLWCTLGKSDCIQTDKHFLHY